TWRNGISGMTVLSGSVAGCAARSRGGWGDRSGDDLAAGDPGAGVSRRLAGVVIQLLVHDYAAAENAVGSGAQADVVHHHALVSAPVGIGFQVAEIAGVVHRAARAPVRVIVRVEMPAGAGRVGSAAVPLLVDVEAVRGVRGEALDVGDHNDPVS